MTQSEALDILKTGANVFLTGEPGSGKTHTINAYVRYLEAHHIYPAITASTGIAATHIGGMTIHSWSGIGIKPSLSPYDLDRIASNEYVAKRIKKAAVLIVDEVSMLAPRMLTMIDAVCREVRHSSEPFGGLQTIFVGDFFQLPPVTRTESLAIDELTGEPEGRFAYEAPVWSRARFITCYLTEQHRQDDDTFLSLLGAIRSNTFTQEHFAHITDRQIEHDAVPENIPKLFSHNADVNVVNDNKLSNIQAEEVRLAMSGTGAPALIEMLKKGCLSPEVLLLKKGAEVMCTKNNPQAGFANGTLGVVVRFETGTKYPVVELRDGRQIIVEPMSWVVEENGKIRAEIKQVPLRLAWAITIHKSQGMSMDEAVMDLGQVFEYGQGYVALSRVRRLSGLYLLGFNERTFQVDETVLARDGEFRAESEDAVAAFGSIDKNELVKMHKNFITAAGGTLEASSKVTRDKKIDTKSVTLGLWKEGKTIIEIAKARNLKLQTIFDHIESLFDKGIISSDELQERLSPAGKAAQKEIQKAFVSLKTDKLTPVYEHFKEKHSFDDIRYARMLMGKK